MKVAYYRLLGKEIEVIVITYDINTPKLQSNMDKKFKMKDFLERCGLKCKPRTILELSNGKVYPIDLDEYLLSIFDIRLGI